MKSFVGVVLAGTLICGVSMAQQIKLYVATNGNDAWSGRLPEPNASGTDGPFATLERARSAVREYKRRSQEPISVYIRGGVYYLRKPFTLGPEDSGTVDQPVTYCAYPDENVILSGGRRITNWHKDSENLWVAELAEVKDGNWYFRQLFVGDERQIRARTPNFDPRNPYTGGWLFVAKPEDKDKEKGAFGDTLVRIHTPGDTFQWKINVPADGDYALWLYYAAFNEPHGRNNMDGRTTMSVDGGEPVTLNNLPDTGDWNKFQWSWTATLKLTKGEHRLQWTNVKGGGLNFDAFVLCNDPNWQPKGTELPKPVEGKHVILVQAETFESGNAKEFSISRKSRTKVAKDRFHFKPGDLGHWPQSPEPEIHIFPAWGWVNAVLSVDRIDFDKRIVYVKNRNCTQELRPGNRYFVENVFEALDEPGEWYLDRAEGRLYYWPRDDDFVQKTVIAPVLDRIVDIAGDIEQESDAESQTKPKEKEHRFVEHITFRNLTFKHTKYSLEMDSVYTPDDGAIWMHQARHCAVENCKFLCLGGYAVRLSSLTNENRILENSVIEAGQGGVLLVSNSTARQPHDNVIAGNRIERCGRIWKHVAGVYVTTGSGNLIAHNTITDMPRYGISLKSFSTGNASHNNVVEYNRLLRTNLETNDTGAIETLGRDREDSGNVIRYNFILDAVGLKTTELGEMLTPFYTWGIYLDDYSSGVHVYGNIVARTVRGGVHVHLGRNNVIENNILVDSQNQQIEFNGAEFMANNKFIRNIVYYHQGDLIRVRKWHDKVFAECDNNIYWKVDANLAEINETITPKGRLTQWQAAGYDQNSIVQDPVFVNPKKDNYGLKSDSPALKLGFEPIDVSQIGVRGYQRQRQKN